jgi:hypothetical protein
MGPEYDIVIGPLRSSTTRFTRSSTSSSASRRSAVDAGDLEFPDLDGPVFEAPVGLRGGTPPDELGELARDERGHIPVRLVGPEIASNRLLDGTAMLQRGSP